MDEQNDTHSDLYEIYRRNLDSLDTIKRIQAEKWILSALSGDVQESDDPSLVGLSAADAIRKMKAEKGNRWAVGLHFGWGMAMRNDLRQAGFGEKFFGIDNLDDYYIPLVESALGIFD